MVSDFKRCPTCHEFVWTSSHTCAPIWEARIYTRQYEEGWTDVHANDAESAAAKFCETYDQGGDYDIIRRGSAEVEVRKKGDDKVILVDVEAESVPHYYGRERKSSVTTA